MLSIYDEEKRGSIPLSDSDVLEVIFFTEKGKTVKFSINYKGKDKG